MLFSRDRGLALHTASVATITLHVLTLLACVWLSTLGAWPTAAQVAFTGLFTSQMVLLAMVAALVAAWWMRLTLIAAACAYLCVVAIAVNGLSRPASDIPVNCALTAIPTLMVFSSFVVLRRRYCFVETKEAETQSVIPFRFSLAHLLLATVCVGGVLGVGRLIRQHAHLSVGIDFIDLCAFSGFLGALLSIVAVVDAWAIYGANSCWLRFGVAFGVSGLTGLVPPYLNVGPSSRFFTIPALLVAMTSIVLVSLSLVNQGRYRLARLKE